MNFDEMTMEMVEARLAEIKNLVETKDENSDFEALSAEVDALEARKSFLVEEANKAEEQRKADIVAVANGAGEETTITIPMEEKSMKTLDEIRASQEYIDAFAKYIKTNSDKEARALLSELATDGQVPVPTFLEDGIKTAWEKDEFLSRVKRSYMAGLVRVGFELSATGAVVHTEGTAAPSEEELTIGIVTLTPSAIKKWITISDEALDLTGEAFLRYIYDELTYRIAAKSIEEGMDAILNAPTTATATKCDVAEIESPLSATTVAEAISELSDRATDNVVIINKKSLKNFKAIAYAAGYPIDVFEGLPVIFNSKLTAYDEATDGDIYAIVGDLKGLQYNFPNGSDISIKMDDLSLAEADLVKFVGREYVAIGVTAPKSFTRVAFKDGES